MICTLLLSIMICKYVTYYRSMIHTVMLHALCLTVGDTCYQSATQINDLSLYWRYELLCWGVIRVTTMLFLLCVLSIYMMHAIYSIDLYDVRYTCYRSVTMHDMLSIYDAISTIHSIIMVLYTTCYLSMRWVIYILSILWCCMLCA